MSINASSGDPESEPAVVTEVRGEASQRFGEDPISKARGESPTAAGTRQTAVRGEDTNGTETRGRGEDDGSATAAGDTGTFSRGETDFNPRDLMSAHHYGPSESGQPRRTLLGALEARQSATASRG